MEINKNSHKRSEINMSDTDWLGLLICGGMITFVSGMVAGALLLWAVKYMLDSLD